MENNMLLLWPLIMYLLFFSQEWDHNQHIFWKKEDTFINGQSNMLKIHWFAILMPSQKSWSPSQKMCAATTNERNLSSYLTKMKNASTALAYCRLHSNMGRECKSLLQLSMANAWSFYVLLKIQPLVSILTAPTERITSSGHTSWYNCTVQAAR